MSSEGGKDQQQSASEALTNCILSQYRFCAGGVGLGAAYAIKYSKGPMPMAMAGVAGTVGDLIYGYYEACKIEADRYERETGRRRM
eukprot:CAMPEP_0203666130 /NCGR_PEP_ID=MMETSP0090-20130426/3215_1 /ASSEMBLY_ACC=CAM_ASM_001088 /TAXON_ID=426623 /ORGANISM="Chaetoceros affinis, Strain CCMP159" /LENGTH=85 /DNA_ID=CAMNT_0050529915 /DNA_START=53 /DNA_END=310 /DNA_ORIENTATION=-